jgi:hypothetical protein
LLLQLFEHLVGPIARQFGDIGAKEPAERRGTDHWCGTGTGERREEKTPLHHRRRLQHGSGTRSHRGDAGSMQGLGDVMRLRVRGNEDGDIAGHDWSRCADAFGDRVMVEQIDDAVRDIGEDQWPHERHRDRLPRLAQSIVERHEPALHRRTDRAAWIGRTECVVQRVFTGNHGDEANLLVAQGGSFEDVLDAR